MLSSFARTTIQRIRAELLPRDVLGNQELDWVNAPEVDIHGCVIYPGATDELTVGRNTALIQWTVIAPADADIRATDRIKVDGKIYEIDGEPGRWRSASGTLDSLVLLLRKWEG